MKTKAAILHAIAEPLEIWEIDIPQLSRGQVLVEMAYSGLCHSQLNEWKGTKGPDAYLPHTLGHEGSGIVLEVGEGVTKVKAGDHVVLSWIKGSGIDAPGTTYRKEGQIINSGAISTFLEKTVVAENRLIPISKEFPLKEAALLGCAIPTGAGVVFNEMRLQPGQSIVIFGVGGIGSSAILAANHANAFPIVAVDIHKEKLEKAMQLGATHTIDASQKDVAAELSSLFKGKGADFALESAGVRRVMEMAFDSIKANGGHCILAGNLPKGEKIQIDPFELIKGKKITGTWGGSSRIDQDIPHFANIFLKDRNRLQQLISQEVTLNQINQLMESLSKGYIGRGLIAFSK